MDLFSLAFFQAFSPELILFAGLLLMLITGLCSPRQEIYRQLSHLMGITLLLLAFYFLAGFQTNYSDGMLVNSPITAMLKGIALLAFAVHLLMLPDSFTSEEQGLFEVSLMVVFMALGAVLMISSNQMLILYLGSELVALASFVLAAARKGSVQSSEAGVKYFVLGALASAVMLLGMSFLYGASGGLSYADLAALDSDNLFGRLGAVLLSLAFMFKISLVPMHMWTPDVYDGAPIPVTALFATAGKVAPVAVLYLLWAGPLSSFAELSFWLFAPFGLASICLGGFAALQQARVKRLMAYSSIVQMGFLALCLAIGPAVMEQIGFFFLLVYLFTNIAIFAFLTQLREGGRLLVRLDELAGLVKSKPLVSVALLLMLFSLAGIPPMPGFFAKLYVLFALIEAESLWFAVLAVLGSVVAAFYYIRLIKLMFFDPAVEPCSDSIPAASYYVATLMLLFLLGLTFFHGLLIDRILV